VFLEHCQLMAALGLTNRDQSISAEVTIHSVGYNETRCNYANALLLCDRLFGTFREGEAECVGQDERKRLSIRQQFMFPV